MNKIFCVGLNKTGTTTLHKAFEILGLKSVHYMDDEGNCIADEIPANYLAGDNILKGFEKYDAFSDWVKGPHAFNIVKEFHKQYPDSKFIVNIRDLESWLDSREKHVKRAQEKKRKNPEAVLPWLEIDREGWEIEYKKYYPDVTAYFKTENINFLLFDVVNGDGWDKLCPFLGLPIPAIPFLKENVGSQEKVSPKEKSIFQRISYRIKILFS